MPSPPPDTTPPPTAEEISGLREFPDPRDLRLDISGLVLEFAGLPAALAAALERRYALFATEADGAAPADLRIQVRDAQRPHFIPPSPEVTNRVYRLCSVHEEGGLRMVAHGFAGWFRVPEKRGALALCHGSFDPPERAVENFLRACVAWTALGRGGFLIHSASIVRDGMAYLFFGASGAGKSTLAAMNREGQVVSDDLTLVLPDSDGRLSVAGAPFRGTYTGGEPVTGRFPIHSAYRLRQDDRAFVVRPDAPVALAELTANLPFVVDQIPRIPELAARLEDRLRRVPTYDLHFCMASTFWGAIERYHAGPS